MLILPPTRDRHLDLASFELKNFSRPGYVSYQLRSFTDTEVKAETRARFAKQMVEELVSGKTVKLNYATQRTLQLLTISKKNGWVGIEVTGNNLERLEINLAFFPKPEHVEQYFIAGRRSRFGGPAERYPGSVGILKMRLNFPEATGYLLELQSSIKHQDEEAKKIINPQDGQNLKTYYYHWSTDLMKIALDFMQRAGIEVVRIRNQDCPSRAITEKIINHQILLSTNPNLYLSGLHIMEKPQAEVKHWDEFRFGSKVA